MPKSYTDELTHWAKKREGNKPRKDLCTVSFLAVKEDVKAALESGYSRKIIWEHMSELGKIQSSYQTFVKQIKKHIKGDPIAQNSNLNLIKTSKQTSNKQKSNAFTFNPKPNKEDLL